MAVAFSAQSYPATHFTPNLGSVRFASALDPAPAPVDFTQFDRPTQSSYEDFPDYLNAEFAEQGDLLEVMNFYHSVGMLLLENHLKNQSAFQEGRNHDVEYDVLDQSVQEFYEAASERLFGTVWKDQLTGALGRYAFQKISHQIYQQLSSNPFSHPAAMFLLDMDNFKQINDTYGHDTGDKALKLTVETLNDIVGDHGSVHRLGGDEFGILIQPATRETAEQIAQDIQSRFATLKIEDTDVRFSVSQGITLLTSQNVYKLKEDRHRDPSIPPVLPERAWTKRTDGVQYLAKAKKSITNGSPYRIYNANDPIVTESLETVKKARNGNNHGEE